MRAMPLVMALCVAAGCSDRPLLVLGDSNTCGLRPCAARLWPARLQKLVDETGGGWRVENWGQLGMTAGRHRERDGSEVRQRITGEPVSAGWHLERMLRETKLADECRGLRRFLAAPKVVLALGTNDLPTSQAWAIADALFELVRRVEEVAPCAGVSVALVPPGSTA